MNEINKSTPAHDLLTCFEFADGEGNYLATVLTLTGRLSVQIIHLSVASRIDYPEARSGILRIAKNILVATRDESGNEHEEFVLTTPKDTISGELFTRSFHVVSKGSSCETEWLVEGLDGFGSWREAMGWESNGRKIEVDSQEAAFSRARDLDESKEHTGWQKFRVVERTIYTQYEEVES